VRCCCSVFELLPIAFPAANLLIGAEGNIPCFCSLVQAWYPAMCIDNLDPDKPNKFTLLGK
jgi:hypothetical protein